jgi:hypothetical protein
MVLSQETRIKARQDLEQLMDSMDQSLSDRQRLDEIEPGMFSRAMSLNRRLLQGGGQRCGAAGRAVGSRAHRSGRPSGPGPCCEETSAAGDGVW